MPSLRALFAFALGVAIWVPVVLFYAFLWLTTEPREDE